MTDSPILDPAALDRLREWGGDKLVGQMVGLFLSNSPTRMEQIRDGVSGGNAGEAEKGSHSLKSSAANVGAESLRALSAQIEDAATGGDIETVKELLPSLEAAYATAITELEAVVKGLPE